MVLFAEFTKYFRCLSISVSRFLVLEFSKSGSKIAHYLQRSSPHMHITCTYRWCLRCSRLFQVHSHKNFARAASLSSHSSQLFDFPQLCSRQDSFSTSKKCLRPSTLIYLAKEANTRKPISRRCSRREFLSQ